MAGAYEQPGDIEGQNAEFPTRPLTPAPTGVAGEAQDEASALEAQRQVVQDGPVPHLDPE
ncbi:MAG: hypothetical protein ACK4N5_25910 [Myxococcales bacterium]